MKKVTYILLAVIVVIIASALSGCSRTRWDYADSDKYTAGNAELNSEVLTLDIEWTSGKVNIKTHEKDTILIEEETNISLTDEQKLHWYLEGNILHIRYCAAQSISWPMFGYKYLTVTVPESLVLNKEFVSTTSADINGSCCAKSINVESNSGSIALNIAGERVSITSTSGSLKLKAKADTFDISTTSGSIDLEVVETCKSARIGSTSGRIYVDCVCTDNISISTTSGAIHAKLPLMPLNTDISSVSGKVLLSISEEPAHSKIHTVSGKYTSSFTPDKKSDRETQLTVSTTSGSVTIEGN